MQPALPLVLLCLYASPLPASSAAGSFLVTGAGGRTGALVYQELKKKGLPVRASVYSLDSQTKAALGCHKCDASEGIFVGYAPATNWVPLTVRKTELHGVRVVQRCDQA